MAGCRVDHGWPHGVLLQDLPSRRRCRQYFGLSLVICCALRVNVDFELEMRRQDEAGGMNTDRM